MKTHELAKDLNLKTTTVLNKTKELGMRKISINSKLTEEEIGQLREALVDVTAAPMVTQEDKKGALLGIVHDGKVFKVVALKATMDQLERLDIEIVGESTTVFGALIEMKKNTLKVINEDTVKVFRKE